MKAKNMSRLKRAERHVCQLCGEEIREPVEDFFCHGCDSYICDDYDAHPCVSFSGKHSPDAHNEREES